VRVIVDTNVLLAGLFWQGAPHALMERARRGTVTLVSSPALLAELADVIGRAKFEAILARSSTSNERTLAAVRQLVEVFDPPPLPQPVCRDLDDDAVLALAVCAQVDLIVSGDEDLLSLDSYQGIPIVLPAQALRLIGVG
jgi:putative PIN family toxin of toxin-antitoxin system